MCATARRAILVAYGVREERRDTADGSACLEPDSPESVGPLRFGMLGDDVEAALPGAAVLHRFQADPQFPEISGVQPGFRAAAPAAMSLASCPVWLQMRPADRS